MTRRYLAIIVVNVILFCVFAEILSLLAYYVDTGNLFYTYRKTYRAIPETAEGKLTGEGLHPYFGPTHKPGYPFDIPVPLRDGTLDSRVPKDAAEVDRRVRTNNFGFVSPHRLPFARTHHEQFIAGVFGGSVAVWFCQIGVPRLIADLKRDPFFKNKEIVPLCFGHEGYKQPQQLLVLAYFLSIGQPFDLVINVDGFNEVALSTLNNQRGLDISMPSVQHLDPLINLVDRATLTPEKLRSLAAISQAKERLNRLIDAMRRNDLAAVNFALERVYLATLNRYIAETAHFGELASNASDASLVAVTPPTKPREGTTLFEDIAGNWARSSVLMHELLAAHGGAYVHVLQPNQYHRTGRVFPAAEASVAFNDASPFKPGAERGYPLLVAAAGSAMSKKVAFFNAAAIFDDESSPVYMDDCCHYTLLGNHKLADFIAAAILSSPGPWKE
jgi:hypothetical protein